MDHALQRLTLVTAVYGRKVALLANMQAYNVAVENYPVSPQRLFVFSPSDELGRNEFDQIVEAYRPKLEQKWQTIEVPAQGIYHALNTGVRAVTTDFLMFYHSDDRILPKALRYLDDQISPETDVLSFCVITQDKIIRPDLANGQPYCAIGINHMSTVFRRNSLLALPFDESMKYSADWKNLIELIESGHRAELSEACVLHFSVDGASNAVSYRRLQEDLRILSQSIKDKHYVFRCLIRALKEIGGYLNTKSRTFGLKILSIFGLPRKTT